MPRAKQPHVVVVGAGAFGGWTALFLRRQGARVTLLDAWGPGNSRASSGGETRVIRATYGPRAVYTNLAARALALWKEHQTQWHRQLYHGIGVLWLVESDDQYEKAALPILREARVTFEELQGSEVARRFPQINCEQVRWAILEKEGGYLTARRACAAVLEGFLAEGGEYRQLAVQPPIQPRGGELSAISLSDDSKLTADHFVFACGPWLGALFPDVIGERVKPTRQEVFFFGTPSGDRRFTEEALPALHVRYSGERVARLQSGRRYQRTRHRSDYGVPSPESRRPPNRPRLSRVPIPRTEGRAAARVARLSVRAVSRRAFHHRSTPRRGERVDRGWGIGPRLQTRPRRWRARRSTGPEWSDAR